MKKRKDKFKNVLNTGETQLSSGAYRYRYTDMFGIRRSVNADTLAELRQKEKEIQESDSIGIDYNSGNITMMELVERYLQLKSANRYNTKLNYLTVTGILKKESFCQRRVKDIKVSDAKLWFMKLQRDGKRYCTITNIRGVVKPAFDLAWDEEIIRRNPFDFKITDAIVNDTVHREALTLEQQDELLRFFSTDKHYSRYYDEVIVLLETGMRVNEFCGLTKKDLDFENKRINVDHQIVKGRLKGEYDYWIEKPKTESGKRILPMTPKCEQALRNILARRQKPKVEMIINGYSGFILLDKNGNPKHGLHIEHMFKWARVKYDKLYPNNNFPHVTPHVLRHTFCTNMARAGMDIKALQYLMGHSDAGVTLNVYAHTSYEHAEAQLKKLHFSAAEEQAK